MIEEQLGALAAYAFMGFCLLMTFGWVLFFVRERLAERKKGAV